MNVTDAVFSGLGGAVVASLVSYLIYLKSKKRLTGKAYEILRGLGKILEEPEGGYYIARSSDDNFHIANHIYSHADGEIIATAFHEDPATYAERDLARAFKYGGSLFTRITTEDICGPDSVKRAIEAMTKLLRGSRFVVIPHGKAITRIDGVFCRFSDNTHLSFMAFRDPKDPSNNRGVVFHDGIAGNFFEYYQTLAREFKPPEGS